MRSKVDKKNDAIGHLLEGELERERFLEGGLERGDRAIGNLAREQESGRGVGGGPRRGQNRGPGEELEGDWRGVT